MFHLQGKPVCNKGSECSDLPVSSKVAGENSRNQWRFIDGFLKTWKLKGEFFHPCLMTLADWKLLVGDCNMSQERIRHGCGGQQQGVGDTQSRIDHERTGVPGKGPGPKTDYHHIIMFLYGWTYHDQLSICASCCVAHVSLCDMFLVIGQLRAHSPHFAVDSTGNFYPVAGTFGSCSTSSATHPMSSHNENW